jgi:hypothetical protein
VSNGEDHETIGRAVPSHTQQLHDTDFRERGRRRIPLLRRKRGEDNGSRDCPWRGERFAAAGRGGDEGAWRT